MVAIKVDKIVMGIRESHIMTSRALYRGNIGNL